MISGTQPAREAGRQAGWHDAAAGLAGREAARAPTTRGEVDVSSRLKKKKKKVCF